MSETLSIMQSSYPARLEVDYPSRLGRLSTSMRLLWILPVMALVTTLNGGWEQVLGLESGAPFWVFSSGIGGSLAAATAAMIVVRRRYPRWWFDFALELTRFGARVGAYVALLTDRYPSTEDQQAVHLELDYPEASEDLNRWLPLVKWLLVLPHYVPLIVLAVAAVFAVMFAWFSILATGRYPQGLFDFVVGVQRWLLRVDAYAFLLITDRYPPFSLR